MVSFRTEGGGANTDVKKPVAELECLSVIFNTPTVGLRARFVVQRVRNG
jgi:hypothetical protein